MFVYGIERKDLLNLFLKFFIQSAHVSVFKYEQMQLKPAALLVFVEWRGPLVCQEVKVYVECCDAASE